jgi:hypothetical protein
MNEEDLKDFLSSVVASAKQVNILTGDHASAPYYEAGAKGNTTKTDEAIKRAVIRLMEEKDEEGKYIVFEQGQFFAIKAVLTSPLCGFPAKPEDFKRVLHNLEIDNLRIPYVYDSVRKIAPHQLPKNVELWGQYENTADEYSMKQVVPAVKLMQLLKEESK